MVHDKENAVVAAHDSELRAIAKSIGMTDAEVSVVKAGRGSPTQIRRLTQALLDAGKLPLGSEVPRDCNLREEVPDNERTQGPPSLADRVRQMMFDYGIGVDCAGYVRWTYDATNPDLGAQWRDPVNEE